MKVKSSFICEVCSYENSKWLGKCPGCESWNSFSENITSDRGKASTRTTGSISRPKKMDEIEAQDIQRYSSGICELDRVLGGGIVPGGVVLVGGEPGIGKSTLLLELCGKMDNLKERKILYVSGEESEAQILDRFKRLKVRAENLQIYHETIWENIKSHLDLIHPDVLILDSIQTTHSQELTSIPGTITQIRDVAFEVMNYSKQHQMASFVVGHITKDGVIAGPKILEHMVDTVIYFEGDRSGMYRMLRVMKNRFGSTQEVGIFEMQESGLKEVLNPSQYFLDNPLKNSYGRTLTCVLEGNRPIFVELQALVVDSKFGQARRTTQGVDSNRVAMLVAILEKYFGLAVSYNDIYLNVVGGIKLSRTDSDLGILAALLSSIRCFPVAEDIIFLGEVGLTGEVRSVFQMGLRLKEMEILGYKKLITSKKSAQDFRGKSPVEMIGIERANELEKLLFQR